MDTTKRNILIAIGVGLLVMTVTLMALNENKKKKPSEPQQQTESTVSEPETQVKTVPVEENENEIDEDILYEANDFYETLQKEEPVVLAEVSVEEAKSRTIERDAIAAVLENWDYEKEEVKDTASRKKITFAEGCVEQLPDTNLKTKLQEILRRVEAEFSRREVLGEFNEEEDEPESTTSEAESTESAPETTPTPTPTSTSTSTQITTPTPTPQVKPTNGTTTAVSTPTPSAPMPEPKKTETTSSAPTPEPQNNTKPSPESTTTQVNQPTVTLTPQVTPSNGTTTTTITTPTPPIPTPSPLQPSNGTTTSTTTPQGNNSTTSTTTKPTVTPTVAPSAQEIQKQVLYSWVEGKKEISGTEITDQNPYILQFLPSDIQALVLKMKSELTDGKSKTFETDKEYSLEETLTLLQAIDDIYFPYKHYTFATGEKDGRLVLLDMNEARKIYKENQNISTEVKNKAKTLFTQKITEKQAVIDINNYICDHMDVSEGSTSVSNDDPLKSGHGDCRVFAAMFKDMCNAIGIQCDVQFGTIGTDPQRHGWVKVNVDGIDYFCDSLWNDGGNDEFPFMFSDKLWYGRVEKYPCIGFSENELIESNQ